MADTARDDIGAAIGRIPSGLFILTARYEDRSGGMLASWVQQTCFEPPMVSVAVAKGRPIMPLISDARTFGLCQIAEGDKVALRKFAGGSDPDDDPFLGFELVHDTVLGVPLLAHTLTHMECELVCHMDVEGDHDLFVGLVRAGRCQNNGEPRIHLRDNGFHY